MPEELTQKQRLVLEYIISQIRSRGFPPTVRDIASHFNLKSPCAPFVHLQALEKKGYIKKDPTKPRAIEVLVGYKEERDDYVKVPMIGKISAGLPILAEENIEGEIILDKELVKRRDCFSLKVEGDSMIEAGIFDGDFVIVKSQNTAENGDIVVALIGQEEATVKYYYRKKGQIILQPANSRMEPQVLEPDEVLIQGQVIGLFRKF